MVAKQKARLPNRGRGPERLRGVHWQWKAFCESLQRLVAALFGFVELEASASPSTKFVVGLEPVQPTSSDDIVKARCLCVDGSRRGGGDHSLPGARRNAALPDHRG